MDKDILMNNGVDNKLVGHLNDRIVLRHLLIHKQLSKAQLSKMCKLTPRSIQLIINRLSKRDLVKELPVQKGKVGQPSTPIALNPNGAFSIGIKVGRRRLTVQTSNLCLDIDHRIDRTYQVYDEAELLKNAKKLLDDIHHKIPTDKIKGITCVAPFEYIDVVGKLSSITNKKITSLIDIHAAAIAEKWIHKIPSENYFYIFIGTYITGVMVINDRIYGNTFNKISDFGALSLESKGKTLHNHCSLIYLDSKLTNMNEKGVLVNGLTGTENLNIKEFSSNTKEIIEKWIDNATYSLGKTLTQIQYIMNLDYIVIETALPKTLRKIICQKISKQTNNIKIIEGSIGASARSYGAAIYSILPYFQSNLSIYYQ